MPGEGARIFGPADTAGCLPAAFNASGRRAGGRQMKPNIDVLDQLAPYHPRFGMFTPVGSAPHRLGGDLGPPAAITTKRTDSFANKSLDLGSKTLDLFFLGQQFRAQPLNLVGSLGQHY
jgi:hypothetical protein